jgi:AbiV family abortive infection protein
MLEDDENRKRKLVQIPKETLEETIRATHEGITKKLEAAKLLLTAGGSVEITAGLYTFALEEYGKLLILKRSYKIKNKNEFQICYANRFANHDNKFLIASDGLSDLEFEDCLLLNQDGEFSREFSVREFNRGDLVTLEARLAIFYVDFVEKEGKINLQAIPRVDATQLNLAIDKLLLKVKQSDLLLEEDSQFLANCMNDVPATEAQQ